MMLVKWDQIGPISTIFLTTAAVGYTTQQKGGRQVYAAIVLLFWSQDVRHALKTSRSQEQTWHRKKHDKI